MIKLQYNVVRYKTLNDKKMKIIDDRSRWKICKILTQHHHSFLSISLSYGKHLCGMKMRSISQLPSNYCGQGTFCYFWPIIQLFYATFLAPSLCKIHTHVYILLLQELTVCSCHTASIMILINRLNQYGLTNMYTMYTSYKCHCCSN